MEPEDAMHPLNKKATKFIEVLGKFLFYAHEIDSIMLTALSAVAAEQANPTTKMLLKTKQLLDYATTNISNMILAIHSDVSHLSEPKAKSRVGGHFFMSTDTAFPPIMSQYIIWHK